MKSNTYSVLQRWLHWLALNPAAVRRLAFDLERQFALPTRYKPIEPGSSLALNTLDPASGAVYVCGLARSGTTILLQILDQIDDFRSLTYRDMPFVLAPNLWKCVTRHAIQQSAPTERAHGDGIMVDFDSPEAFEEVFWRTFSQHVRTKDSLSTNEPSPEVLTAFADYRALVANPKTEARPISGTARRYLSKNNNNLLRLRSLCADPTATVLLVYRDPVATARSLHRQHRRFCATQTQNPFTRTYMGWLGHHEFGVDHLPFGMVKPEMDASYSPDDLNYWLDYWNAVYRHVLRQNDLPLNFVSHAALCAQPLRMLNSLFGTLGVQANATILATQIVDQPQTNAQTKEFCPELLHKAATTHRELLASPKNLLNLE